MSMAKHVFNVKEVAEYLGVSSVTIYRHLKDSAIPAFRMGKNWRFNKESIDKWRLEKEKKNKK